MKTLKICLCAVMVVMVISAHAATVLDDVWSGYRTMISTEAGKITVVTDGNSGTRTEGAYYADYGKGVAMFVMDRQRADSYAALVVRDESALIGCSVHGKSERSEKIIRRAKDAYAAPIGKTSLTAFDLCRLAFGDDTERYHTKVSGGNSNSFVAIPKVYVTGDCDENLLVVARNGSVPVLAQAYCRIAGASVRAVTISDTRLFVIGGKTVWRPDTVVFDNSVIGKVTVIRITERVIGREIGALDGETLKNGKPRGWVWK